MKKILPLLLVAALLCGCSENTTGSDVEASVPDSVTEESGNRYESYDFLAYSEEIKYNPNPDNSGKSQGSANADSSYSSVKLENIIGEAFGIAVIKVTEDGEPLEYSMAGDNKELEQAMLEKYGKVDMAVVDVVQAEVMYSISGGHEIGEEISISGNNDLEIGKEYLIITKEYEESGKIYFPSISGAIGIFDISDDFTVVSKASAYTAAKYDGLSLADTAHDLKTMFDNARSD